MGRQPLYFRGFEFALGALSPVPRIKNPQLRKAGFSVYTSFAASLNVAAQAFVREQV
jgi:hypothetical protein